jgi:hypothetical protein
VGPGGELQALVLSGRVFSTCWFRQLAVQVLRRCLALCWAGVSPWGQAGGLRAVAAGCTRHGLGLSFAALRRVQGLRRCIASRQPAAALDAWWRYRALAAVAAVLLLLPLHASAAAAAMSLAGASHSGSWCTTAVAAKCSEVSRCGPCGVHRVWPPVALALRDGGELGGDCALAAGVVVFVGARGAGVHAAVEVRREAFQSVLVPGLQRDSAGVLGFAALYTAGGRWAQVMLLAACS